MKIRQAKKIASRMFDFDGSWIHSEKTRDRAFITLCQRTKRDATFSFWISRPLKHSVFIRMDETALDINLEDF